MSTNDVPGAKGANLDILAMGCWAESPDGSLLFVSSTENGRVIYSMFDVRPDGAVVEYRDAMPQRDFEIAFTWKADKAKAKGKASTVPDIRWTWHDKTPFPWDRVIKQGARDGVRYASAADQLSDAERVRRSMQARAPAPIDADDLETDAERVASALGAIAENFDPTKVQHLVQTFGKSMQRIGKALAKLGG